MDAFDADVLIYAAAPAHPLGRKVAMLFADADELRVGSTLLLPELLSKPVRTRNERELARLAGLLARIELRPLDVATADLATALGAMYGLRAPDAVHLATAVAAGADRFVTNNRRDFPTSIAEIDVVFPDALPEPS